MGEIAHDPAVTVDRFRQALAAHAAGVVVISAEVDGGPVGLTATSFCSASLEPPLVSCYVNRSSATWLALRRADHFAVNVLSCDQAQVAARFASKGIDRFAQPTGWRPGPRGVPLLAGVCGHLVCVTRSITDVGDHALVVGLVTDTRSGSGTPLLYHSGRFGCFTQNQ